MFCRPRRFLWIIPAFLSGVAAAFSGCLPRDDTALPTAEQGRALSVGAKLTPSERDALAERRDAIRGWARRCGPSVTKDGCDVGDSVLFDGILCLSGEADSCDAVAQAQGPDGRVWRAAHRVGYETRNSFSRDMALGALAYVVATRDTGFAQRWIGWIEANGKRTCREATDNRCNFTPGFWNLFGVVWEHVGLPTTPSMRADRVDNAFVLPLQARVAPAGFPLHLTAVNVLLRRAMGRESEFTLLATGVLAQRQPDNPFFLWLREGNSARVATAVSRACPERAPAHRAEWAFERSQDSGAQGRSMGWECVALINLMLEGGGAASTDLLR
jgi:hypothetical protein